MNSKKHPSDLSAADLIKYLNGRRGWHGNQYRSVCGEWLRKADSANAERGEGLDETPCSPKIIQILIAPNDSTWQGILLGLGDDGITYQVVMGTKWEPMIPPINSEENAEVLPDPEPEVVGKLVEQLRGYDKHLRVCMDWTVRASELEVSSGMQKAQLACLKAAKSFLDNIGEITYGKSKQD